jgi:hypothetical protein
MYLTVCAIAGPIFLFCSFWVYHYVDLDFDTSSQESDEDDSARPSYGPSHLFLPPSMHAAASPMTPGSFNMVEDTRMKLQSGREDGSRF